MSFPSKHLQHPVAHYLAWLGVALFATYSMDIWGVILHCTIGPHLPNYNLLGRYIIIAFKTHHLIVPAIHNLPAQPYENLVGWLAHTAVGIVDTFIYMIIIFKILHTTPHFWLSIFIGWLLIFMPFLIEQPMLGMGVAAKLTANPDIARLITFTYHTVFGICLFWGSVIFHRVFVLMTHCNKVTIKQKLTSIFGVR